jgi:hypothetical protein
MYLADKSVVAGFADIFTLDVYVSCLKAIIYDFTFMFGLCYFNVTVIESAVVGSMGVFFLSAHLTGARSLSCELFPGCLV